MLVGELTHRSESQKTIAASSLSSLRRSFATRVLPVGGGWVGVYISTSRAAISDGGERGASLRLDTDGHIPLLDLLPKVKF